MAICVFAAGVLSFPPHAVSTTTAVAAAASAADLI
jgi:hypothetical protein